MNPAVHGRCDWCRVPLRWWQPTYCRRCKRALRCLLCPMPFQANSRRYARPDCWLWFR